MVPEEVTDGMGEEEIKAIEGRNKIKRERFRVAVLQLMQENAEFIKQAIADGRQIYFGTYFSEKHGKIALDISELIPYDPKDSESEAKARAKAVADATTRNQESAARIEPMPGEGRGTGSGFGLNFDNPDAFPSTGLPENAMAGYRAWKGRRWSSENLPDLQQEPISPGQAAAPNDGGSGMDEMQKRLEETLRNSPEEQLAQDNLRMLLEAKGLSAEAIAARIEEVRRGTVAAQQATEAESRKSDAVEESAVVAEEDASMFEDFTDEERNEDYYEDDEGGSYEVLPEEIATESEAQDAAADRIIAAKEQETQAAEDAATASESHAEEVSQALETIADSSGDQATETMIFDSETEAKMQRIAELVAARDKLIADRDKLIAEEASAIEDALAVLQAADISAQEDQVRKVLSDADKYMAEKEAEFRLTEKGAKVSAKTGEYVNQFVPEIYNSDTKEYQQMLRSGMVPDKASNTFNQKQKYIFDRLSQLQDIRRNPADTFNLGNIKSSSGTTLSSEFMPASDFEIAQDVEAGQSPDLPGPTEAEVSQATSTLLDVRSSVQSFGDEIDAVSTQIRNLQEEIAPGSTLPKGPSMATSGQEQEAAARAAKELNPEATARAQEQILPLTARLSEMLGKAIEEARASLTAKGVSGAENLSAEELEKALAGSSIGRKLDYLLQVQRQVSATGITNAGEVKAGILGDASPEYPMAARKGKVSSYDKNAAELTGLSINDVRYLAQLIPTIAAQLSALENAARGTSGEVAQLGDASSKTTENLLGEGGQGGQGGGGGGTATGGPSGPMDDPNNDWRKIRAKIPDTDNIPRGLKDLAALQNRFNELAPAILHVGDANKGFSKSLDESNKKAQQASAALATLTNTNVGVLRAVRTQVGRAATFLVLQQLGREIGGVVSHLQSGIFGFNQVLENTQVGFNTLFANTLQANASIGNELVPKLNEAGVQIGFMREQAVKFADAIDFTKGAAEGMVSQIRDIANVTPFRFQPLVEASLKMKAFGFEAAEIPGMINSISNAVAALGGDDEKIDRIAYALGQMNSAGRVYQNDMMQLANAGIAGYRMLSEKLLMDLSAIKKRSMGLLKDLPEETIAEFKRLESFINTGSFKKSFGSIDQMIETLQDPKRAEGLIRALAKRGFLLGSTAARAITDGMDRQYQGSADRLSRTMTGALSTIADLSQNFMATAFQPLFNSVRDTIVEIGQFMLKSKEITKFVDEVRRRMQDFITSLSSFGPALQAAGQIFVDVFVSGLGSALDKGTAFGNVITGVIANLGPGLKLIGDILTNDVGKGLVVATLAFSLFSKAVTANPMIASITLLIAAISGIAAAIKENSILTAFVGSFVKTFIPSIEQFFKVIGDAFGTIAKDLSSGGLSGFVLGLSAAIDVLMPLLTIFLASMSVLLKIITPFAKPLGVLIGLFLALKTAMMAYDMAGSIVGKVMNSLGGAWSKVNDSIDTQISKVKQTAAAYEELGAAKRAAEDFKRNERGEMLDERGRVTTDKSKAALLWGEGERVNSYGMTESKGRGAQIALQGRGFIPGLLDMERNKQQTMDLAQNAMGVRPDFGAGFHLSHPDNVLPHTEPVVSNKSIEDNYGYLAGAESRLAAFNVATQGKTLTPEEESKKKDLEEAARLRQEASKLGMFRFAGLDAGVSVTGEADINKNAGAYSMDNLMSAINMQKQISFVINTAYANLEQAGNDIKKLADEITYLENELKKATPGTEEHDALTAQLAAKRAENEASIAKIKGSTQVQESTAIIGGLIEANGGDATDLVGQFAKGRPINIPKGSAEAIKALPDKVRNIVTAKVLEKQAKGENFLTKQEIEDITTGALGDARGKAALKGMTVGISKKLAGMLTSIYNSIAGKAPKMFQTIERGGGKTGLREIDSRQGKYYYVDQETGLLGNEEVTAEELQKRKRLKGGSKISSLGKYIGPASLALGLASGASRLAGQVAPILSAPIIGPLMDALPKEMTSIFRQKAGPFQAMAAGIGTAAGSALGQALIPIPGLGAALGGMIGGALGELVGNFVDKMMSESESIARKKKALFDEAKFLGFTDAQSKAIVEDKFGKTDFIQNMMTADPMADLRSSYTIDKDFNPMTEDEYNRRYNEILGSNQISEVMKPQLLQQLDDERLKRNASSSFDQRQADFMKTAMDPEMLKQLFGVDNLFAKRDAEKFRMANEDLLKSIDGKIARDEALTKQEEELLKAYKKLQVEAESSPLGMFGTITDSRAFSPTMMFDALAYSQPRSEYTQADVDAGAKKADGTAVTVDDIGKQRDNFLEVKDLMLDPVIQSMTRAAGFGDKVADALDAFGFDITKITRDMSNLDVIALMKETLSVGVRRAERAKALTPKIDVTMTRTQMMEEYGAEFGYNKFDELEAQRAEYAKQVAAFEKMGGEKRLAFLQEYADQKIAGGYKTFRNAPAGVERDQYGGKDTSYSVLQQDTDLLTTAERAEYEKLQAQKEKVAGARYVPLTVKMKYRMATEGASPEEQAQGVAAEQAFKNFRQANQAALTAATAAGLKATKEQLDLLKQETVLRDKAYTTKERTLDVGEALAVFEGEGIQISNKELANNKAIQEILLAKQNAIKSVASESEAVITAKVAELQAEGVITEIVAEKTILDQKQVELERKKKVLLEMQGKLIAANASGDKDQIESAQQAVRAAEGAIDAQGRSIADSQTKIKDLTAKAAAFFDAAEKANPFKLTKKELDEIKKLIAKDPGSILGGDGGKKDAAALQKNIDLLGKMASIAQQAYDRLRKAQQRTHDEYIKQLDEQEKRINERYQQRSDQQTEENLQAQLQIAGLQMRSQSADPLEAAKSFYDAKQALEQFYIDKQKEAELKVISDEKERYEKEFGASADAQQAIYDAALKRLQSRFDFAQSVLNGDEKMAGKMNDSLKMTMFGTSLAGDTSMLGTMISGSYQNQTTANDDFKKYAASAEGKKYADIKKKSASNRTTTEKNIYSKYNALLAAARKENALNAIGSALRGDVTGSQDITMTTEEQQALDAFESQNREAIAEALAAGLTKDNSDILAQLETMREEAKTAESDALVKEFGAITTGIRYNSDKAEFTPTSATSRGFSGGIKGLTYGGKAMSTADMKVFRGTTEESGLQATFMNEAIMSNLRYQDANGKEYAGAGNILSYITGLISSLGGGATGIAKLNDEQEALYTYLMTLVSAKNTFTTAQKTAILAQRTLEQGLNDFEQATGVDINIANLAEADVTDKQFTDYFNALGKTFEDNAAREEAIQKMRDVLRDTYGQALLSVDVEQYAKFADSSDPRIGALSGVVTNLKDVMTQIDNVMSAGAASKMTSLDKLLFGQNFDPNNLSGAGNPISNIMFGKTQIDAVSAAVIATRDSFESSMNSIKAYAAELGGPLGAFHQQTIEESNALGQAMGTTASAFSIATEQVNMYAQALNAAAAARAGLSIDPNFASGIGNGTAGTMPIAPPNNTYNITVNNAEGMNAQQLAAELARLIAQQAGSTVN
jgi:tape measure domain-containing protein